MQQKNNSFKKILQNKKFLISAGAVIILLVLLAAIWAPVQTQPEPLSLSEVASGIASGQVVKIEDTLVTGELVVHYADGSTQNAMRDTASSLLEQLTYLNLTGKQLAQVEFSVHASQAMQASKTAGTLVTFGAIFAITFLAFRMVENGPMKMQKKTFEEGKVPGLRFNDVAGMEENMQELRDIVTFLKDGDKYSAMGARMPRGVLLVGDPGTGKTMIAKAVAGEAGVPFFAISGSEFVEVFAGVGASRVRSLFQKARKKAPCIIFIDEIDAVGRERHSSGSGAEMEQDQTLNQLLVEMDGFDTSESVVVLAATNRIDVLDSALTRPGRFDRRVYVSRPDVKGREAILNVHIKGKKLGEDVAITNVARATPGLVGADLANIVNEAAIMAVRNEHQTIEMHDFEEAVEKCIAGGVQRKSRVMSEEERRIIAYHEAGHAVAMHESPHSDPVYKITIIPRGQAGGYTLSLPVEDHLLISKNKILARIVGLMGGRAAEEIFFQDITSGASNDLQVATQLAEEMVMRLGMDDSSGLRVFQQPQGYAALAAPRSSQKTFETIDESVKSILDGCYTLARNILNDKRRSVERLACELLETETVSRERFVELMGGFLMNPETGPLPVYSNASLNTES
jgi:cell division protease FtsH